MNIFHKVTLETLKKNRVRTLVTIIGIILSAAMICAVTTFASSFQNFLMEDAKYDYGDYYGKSLNVTNKKIQELKEDSRLSRLVMSQSIGYSYLEGCVNEYKPYIFIMGADKDFAKALPVHITSGRLPVNSSEILIPEHIASNGNVNFSLGDTISLNIGQRISGDTILYQNTSLITGEDGESEKEELQVKETRNYTVVGFYKRPGFEDYSAPGYTAITVMDKDSKDSYLYDIYFKTRNPKDVYGFMEEHKLGVYTNWSLLAYSGASRYEGFYSVLYGMGGIFIGLIMFGSISLIYNAFAISVSDRTKQFGLLVSVGATKKQIRSSVLYEALVLSLVGIPLGVLSGIGGIGITLYLLKDKLTSLTGSQLPMTLSVSWVSVITAAIIALITVTISAWIPSKRAVRITAIEAIRQSNDIAAKPKQVKTSPLIYKLFGLEGMIASKYFKRSRKRYKATIISLFMSIVLFISASSFCMYLTESVSGAMDTLGYDIIYTFSSSGDDKTYQDVYRQLSAVKGVTKSAYGDDYSIYFMITPDCYSQDYLNFLKAHRDTYNAVIQYPSVKYQSIFFIEDKIYEEFLKEQNLDTAKYMDITNPVALVYDSIKIFDQAEGKYYNTHMLKGSLSQGIYMCEPKEYEGYTFQYYAPSENGDTVMVYEKNDTQESINLPLDEYTTTTGIPVGEIVDKAPFFISPSGDSITFMYPYSALKTVMGPEYNRLNPSMYFKSSDHAATYQAMKKILEEGYTGDVESNLRDYASRVEDKRNTVTVIRVFAYGFIVLISLIALANVFNTISTNIALRRREFAMLRSVGMTSKGFNKMMNFECILYGIRSLMVGLPVSIGVTYLIYRVVNSGYEMGFHLSWLSIGVAVFSVFTVVFSTMMYAMGRIKKDNPIDALRNENL